MDDNYETVKLEYTIHKYSSYSANYVPANITVNNPTDQLSRWFTDSNTPSQHVMLKLKAPAIVKTITFGKYIKAHVSDLKKFTVLGGTDDTNLSELLSAGLKNDSMAETFHLRHRTVEGLHLPILYLKIVPLQSWGPAYNYTIWFVELQGTNNEEYVQSTLHTISLRKEEEAVRILLKHLRRRRYKDAFEALSRETGVHLEGPTQARLWNALVENGDYELAEQILEQAVTDGELDWYISWQPYTPHWTQISPCSVSVEERLCRGHGPDAAFAPLALPAAALCPPLADVSCSDREWMNSSAGSVQENCDTCETYTCCSPGSCSCKPGPRGGHQLVVDPANSTLYLYGGWDGTEDLADLWSYSVSAERWALLCRHSGQACGPSPRSCHKMVLDPVHRRLYTLGRYLDVSQRVPSNMQSDLYMFDIVSCEWSLVCADTSAVGGPKLVFDHQMCIDPDTQTIYVFGGRVLPSTTEEAASAPQYSGLYAYYISTDTWQLLLADQHTQHAPQPRVGHSMLFHPVERRLYIFAGQRNKEHLLDLWWWDVGTGQCGALAAAAAPCPPPAAGFTQRATIDPHTDEIFVLSGLSKEKDKRVCNALWVFSLRRATWTCAYRNERASSADPRPRFAHQLVYDPVQKVHYLFGGNPGQARVPRLRLDDLWALRLHRPPLERVARRARAALREARYRELLACAGPAPTATALHYLRNNVHDAVDHSDPQQVEQFHALATALFAGPQREHASTPSLTPSTTRRLARRKARAVASGGGASLSRALAAVLGAEDAQPDPPEPYDDAPEPEQEPWDVADAADDEVTEPEWDTRTARIALYETLSQYFRPGAVPPKPDVTNLVKL